eukprot:1922225-Prymnesium_polylepis.1
MAPFYLLRARVRSCADERAGEGLEALPALETRMAGTSGSGLSAWHASTKFGRVAPPSRVYVAGAPRPPVR